MSHFLQNRVALAACVGLALPFAAGAADFSMLKPGQSMKLGDRLISSGNPNLWAEVKPWGALEIVKDGFPIWATCRDTGHYTQVSLGLDASGKVAINTESFDPEDKTTTRATVWTLPTNFNKSSGSKLILDGNALAIWVPETSPDGKFPFRWYWRSDWPKNGGLDGKNVEQLTPGQELHRTDKVVCTGHPDTFVTVLGNGNLQAVVNGKNAWHTPYKNDEPWAKLEYFMVINPDGEFVVTNRSWNGKTLRGWKPSGNKPYNPKSSLIVNEKGNLILCEAGDANRAIWRSDWPNSGVIQDPPPLNTKR